MVGVVSSILEQLTVVLLVSFFKNSETPCTPYLSVTILTFTDKFLLERAY